MLTPPAITTNEDATTAPTYLLAPTIPGYTGGMVVAEQVARGDSSRGGSRAKDTYVIPDSRLIGRMTAEAQSARDAFEYGTLVVDGKTYRMREDWEAVMDRHAAKYGVVGDD